jgi:hypothetical protein
VSGGRESNLTSCTLKQLGNVLLVLSTIGEMANMCVSDYNKEQVSFSMMATICTQPPVGITSKVGCSEKCQLLKLVLTHGS